MVLAIPRKTYPLLKVTIPLAILLGAIGLWQISQDPDHKPMMLLPWLVAGVVVAFAGLLWRRKSVVEVRLPSDELGDQSRTNLEGILATLEAERASGKLTDERYRKARARVEAQMKAKR